MSRPGHSARQARDISRVDAVERRAMSTLSGISNLINLNSCDPEHGPAEGFPESRCVAQNLELEAQYDILGGHAVSKNRRLNLLSIEPFPYFRHAGHEFIPVETDLHSVQQPTALLFVDDQRQAGFHVADCVENPGPTSSTWCAGTSGCCSSSSTHSRSCSTAAVLRARPINSRHRRANCLDDSEFILHPPTSLGGCAPPSSPAPETAPRAQGSKLRTDQAVAVLHHPGTRCSIALPPYPAPYDRAGIRIGHDARADCATRGPSREDFEVTI